MQEWNEKDLFDFLMSEYDKVEHGMIDLIGRTEFTKGQIAQMFARAVLKNFYVVPRDPKLDGKIVICLN